MNGKKKYGKDGYYYPRLTFGSSAFFKSKGSAKKFAKDVGGKIRITKHVSRGKGFLVYK